MGSQTAQMQYPARRYLQGGPRPHQGPRHTLGPVAALGAHARLSSWGHAMGSREGGTRLGHCGASGVRGRGCGCAGGQPMGRHMRAVPMLGRCGRDHGHHSPRMVLWVWSAREQCRAYTVAGPPACQGTVQGRYLGWAPCMAHCCVLVHPVFIPAP